jgi:hypothetical protein
LATQICQDISNRHEQIRARGPVEDLTAAGRGNFFEGLAIRIRWAGPDVHTGPGKCQWKGARQVTNDLLSLIPDRIDNPPTLLRLAYYFLANVFVSLLNVRSDPAGARIHPITKHDDGDAIVHVFNLIEDVLEGFVEVCVSVHDAVAGAKDCCRQGLRMRLSLEVVDDVSGLVLLNPTGELVHIGGKRDDAYLIVLAQTAEQGKRALFDGRQDGPILGWIKNKNQPQRPLVGRKMVISCRIILKHPRSLPCAARYPSALTVHHDDVKINELGLDRSHLSRGWESVAMMQGSRGR